MTSLNTQGQADLLLGDSQTLATYLGVTAKTIERWKAGQPMPTAAFKLMYLPGWRGGFEPSCWRNFPSCYLLRKQPVFLLLAKAEGDLNLGMDN